MSTPMFLLQIVDTHGVVVKLPAGGILETNLRDAIATELVSQGVLGTLGSPELQQRLIDRAKDAAVAKGVGWFKSETTVAYAIEQGLREALDTLEHDLRVEAAPLVSQALQTVFTQLKRQTVAVAAKGR